MNNLSNVQFLTIKSNVDDGISLLLTSVSLKFSSSNLLPTLRVPSSIPPHNNFILLRNKLDYKSAVILHEGKLYLSKAKVCYFILQNYSWIPEFDTVLWVLWINEQNQCSYKPV